MYSQFFGLEKLPFRLRPDPEFLYLGPEYLRARTSVLQALRSGSSRITLLSGPPGVGKTLLLNDLTQELAKQFGLCRINQPQITAAEILQAINLQLGATDIPSLLIIDEAHLLPSGTKAALTQILANRLSLTMLLLARQNVGQSAWKQQVIRLDRMTPEGARAYIEYRLRLAGSGGKDIFTPDSLALIYQHTLGSPRLTNVLCDAALHAACLRASGHVGGSEVALASQDPRWPEALARDTAEPSVGYETAANAGGADMVAEPVATARFIISHGRQSRAWPLPIGRTSIGRASDNALRLETRDVSRHHCEVVISADASVIQDLGSANGMIVNGKTTKHHLLKHADVVRLGEHVLTYEVL